ncbi:indole-3-glycerol-phosphate synthase TrpC [Corynebacterium poyangense]|uniref:indole-3-glycerol-phosphate synthase n=1 Tax=Corynebacterium poyangense TaxID=2684405 RepID=A0A7H0SPN4_9CORY|nr:indole-3-glycerol-phosphate synthase TrpC [Corynebacterium poyangense]MBZ8178096.1 indole-3-glycerol-phosphate synthase TrpC [Corynebacterium poyangense]QNQ90509.1 indole-3-glycerol-phosphate synthase TrpC [Corynebacterium poyangense]
MVPVVVDYLVAQVRRRVSLREAALPFPEIKELAAQTPAPLDPTSPLLAPGCSIITELQCCQPQGSDPWEYTGIKSIAQECEASGAAALSCHTDLPPFCGSHEDMRRAKGAVNIPLLCRDVIIDPYQIHEARFYGADMLTVSLGLLLTRHSESLVDRIGSLGMTPVLEVRNPKEAELAVSLGTGIIGINPQLWGKASIDRELIFQLIPLVRRGNQPIVVLSGVTTPAHVVACARLGADAVIVSRGMSTTRTPGSLTREMVAAGQHPAIGTEN